MCIRILGIIAGWRSKRNLRWTATAALAASLMLAAGGTSAKELVGSAEIDQAVISNLSSLYRINSKVIAHVDLTKPFDTKSQWTLVVGKQPDKESTVTNGVDEPVGAVSVCFVKNAVADCSEAMFLRKCREQNIAIAPFGARPFYELYTSKVVYSGPENTLPLLMIKTGTWSGTDGSHGIFTVLFHYDRKTDRFRVVFFNMTGSNGNQETRFIETGPLLGDVIVADPDGGAPPPTRANPYAYSVEVYKRNVAGMYARVLAYRGGTRYADGNLLAVIDSDMPETLRRLGFWKPGDALPIPSRMPAGCTRLVMRKGVEWCEDLCGDGIRIYREAHSHERGGVLTLRDTKGKKHRLASHQVFAARVSEIARVGIVRAGEVSGGNEDARPSTQLYWIMVGLKRSAGARLSNALSHLRGVRVAIVCDDLVTFEGTLRVPGQANSTAGQRPTLEQAWASAAELEWRVELPLGETRR